MRLCEKENLHVAHYSNETDFVVALRAGAHHCKFEDLKDHDDPREEMIKMRLASGLALTDRSG